MNSTQIAHGFFEGSQLAEIMINVFVLLTFILMEGFLSRQIPEYHRCIENCGEDPLDDLEERRKFDACRDKCNEDELNLCMGDVPDAARRRRCLKEAQKRCIADCCDEERCILFCQFVYSYA
ncbi:hypothetical protein CSKR_113539 [Clonorchis sinensis]|uniref:Uncharacterized protein n=1 Tax=Clonorchis sinensis TaxID=79923 RepID=A0A8T1LWE9_CLOSI|nr:hypothetical protein CSKR_113539 [Clonorchis sinensis]